VEKVGKVSGEDMVFLTPWKYHGDRRRLPVRGGKR
jgi:hypothetical protein